MPVFITGVAGFVGMHLAENLLKTGATVIGIDTLQNAPELARMRLGRLWHYKKFTFFPQDVTDQSALAKIFQDNPTIKIIVHLAARGGVRLSRKTPSCYVHDNIQGYVSLLEAARRLSGLEHILYASSSAVYGRSPHYPFDEKNPLGDPSSFYAVTKRTNELTAQTYSHVYGIPQTGMRFFTVYGPWGRPDMAYYSFARAMRDQNPITLWNGDRLSRDFTYIADVITAIRLLMLHPPRAHEARILNIGRGVPEKVVQLVRLLEKNLNRRAHIIRAPRPSEDIETTWAGTNALKNVIHWQAGVSLEEGIAEFSQWFRDFSPL